MSVGRICCREVDLADLGESAWAAAERMHQRTVGTLVIVDEENKPIGIVTDRDLVVRVMARDLEPRETMIREIMTPCPKSVSEDAPLEDALTEMQSCGVRRIPVVDAEHRLVGILSLDDILLLLADEFTQVGRLIGKEMPRAAAVV